MTPRAFFDRLSIGNQPEVGAVSRQSSQPFREGLNQRDAQSVYPFSTSKTGVSHVAYLYNHHSRGIRRPIIKQPTTHGHLRVAAGVSMCLKCHRCGSVYAANHPRCPNCGSKIIAITLSRIKKVGTAELVACNNRLTVV